MADVVPYLCFETGESFSLLLENFVLFLWKWKLHDVKQNEKYPYAYRNYFQIETVEIIDFSLSNNFWYIAFKVHSVLTDVYCLSNTHTSAVLGENLLK